MYEQMRNEIMTSLQDFLSKETLDIVMSAIDKTATKYSISHKETLPMVAPTIPNECRIYLSSKAIEGLSTNTIKRYGYALKNFFCRINKPLAEITVNDIRMYLYEYSCSRSINNRSLDGMRNILNSFFEWCAIENYIDKNPCKAIKAIKYEKTQRESLTRFELECCRKECKDSIRLSAILEFLYSTGCRVSELCNVKLSDINWIRGTVLLHGKGNKDRYSFINDKCKILLQEYLGHRKQTSDFLFCSVRAPYGKLSKEIIDREFKSTFRELSERFGKPISPHIIRHTTATLGVQSGMDITQAQKMLGHASISTTMIYTEVTDMTVQESHRKYVV